MFSWKTHVLESQIYFCEYNEIFKITYVEEQLQMTAF